jgi:hypothetical protein
LLLRLFLTEGNLLLARLTAAVLASGCGSQAGEGAGAGWLRTNARASIQVAIFGTQSPFSTISQTAGFFAV